MNSIWFKFLCWLGRKFPESGLPIARVYNATGSEHYTLYRDGMVMVESVGSKAMDVLPLVLCSQSLVEAFAEEIGGVR
ncbi:MULTISPECIES: hypothetical protein [Aeromonas]|uniref:hypothetical protein n=1 Tax=Aeromonas TaxID=642 RepID=UPI0023797006|nr:hypothetical protein [Aeromonas bestiarum]WDL82129.1 hypothetical protein IU367_18985 [Aeromonas bestiarum]